MMSVCYSQNIYLSPTVKTIQYHTPLPDTIRLDDRHILQTSIKVLTDNLVLEKNVDFGFYFSSSTLLGYSTLTEYIEGDYYIVLFEPSKYDFINIEYAIFPEKIFEEFKVFEPFALTDTLKVTTLKKNWESLLLDNQRLSITGSKTISVSASNHDMHDINQSLFLRIDGELSPNVFIQAQLNDSQSPITTEGDSRDLSSLDEVYFKIYGREYEIAFGDLDMNISGTQFINYNPKFTGLRLSYYDKNTASGAIAVSNSKAAFISFSGVEGKQGPYYLRAEGIHHNVQILPGTESIWLNGVPLYRGNDYRIDYNEGSIEFTLRHFISENSRIQASFQYTDEYYRKNTMLAKNDYHIGEKVRFRSTVIYQRDDKNKPLMESLTESDIEMLKKAGNSKPYVNGEIYAGEGQGLYRKIQNENDFIYVYAPGEPDADYFVRFTWVGSGTGDYLQITPSRFDYVGKNQGTFLPIREIVAPMHRANYDFSLSFDHGALSLYTESLFSEYDKNTFSSIDNKDNFSQIHHFQASLQPDWDTFNPIFRSWYRFRQKKLYTFANIRNPDESFQFYAFTQPDSLDSNEIYININTFSYNLFRQDTAYKIVNYENVLKQFFLILNQNIEQTNFFPALRYRYNLAESKNYMSEQNTKSNISSHEPTASYKYKVASLRGEARFFENTESEMKSSKKTSGSRFRSYTTQFALENIWNSGVAVSYSNEDNINMLPPPQEEKREERWQRQRQADTWTLQTYTQFNRQYLTALYSHRIVHLFHDEVSEQKFDIAEIRALNSLFDGALQLNTSYILKNTEYFPKARELSYVGQGAGFYDSTGVWTDKGDWDWIVVIIGDPTRSIEVQANLNSFIYPAQMVKQENELYDLFNKINIETNISIMEQTENRDRLKVYFLFPSAIMNEQSIFSQQEWRYSLWYNIQRNKWISRYTYRNNKIKDNRFQQLQTNDIIDHEYSLRLLRFHNSDFEKIFRISNQFDSRYEMSSDIRTNELNIRTSFGHNLIFNTGLGYEREKMASYSNPQKIDRYMFSEDVMYFIGQRYRLNANISIKYNDIKTPINTYLPFEKRQGINLRWLLGINYRMNRISTLNADYSGYKNPTQEAFHQVRMEVRVEF